MKQEYASVQHVVMNRIRHQASENILSIINNKIWDQVGLEVWDEVAKSKNIIWEPIWNQTYDSFL
jgi:hypothetical protein